MFILVLPIYTNVCFSTEYSVLSQVLLKKSQAYYLGGIHLPSQKWFFTCLISPYMSKRVSGQARTTSPICPKSLSQFLTKAEISCKDRVRFQTCRRVISPTKASELAKSPPMESCSWPTTNIPPPEINQEIISKSYINTHQTKYHVKIP